MADDAQQPVRQRVELRLPENYKQVDETVWEELEKHLFTGFLTSTSTIVGQSFVFKTLNHNELRLVEFMKPTRVSAPEARAHFRTAFIAHSIFIVNGSNALFDRPRHINKLIRTVAKLQPRVQEKILESLASLNQRAARLYPLVEVYSYENRSRFKWFHTRGTPVHSDGSTGVPGTGDLGMNLCQQTWTALSQMIDHREDMEREWSNAKFIGGCFAGKGVRSIDERDRGRLERERVDREELKIKVLFKYLNRSEDGREMEEVINLPDGRKATVAKKFKAESAEELLTELSAALSGEKDYHDLVIEKKRQEFFERSKELEVQRNAYLRRPELPVNGPAVGGGGSRILGGRAEADAYLKKMNEIRIRQAEAAQRQAHAPDENSESSDGGGEGES